MVYFYKMIRMKNNRKITNKKVEKKNIITKS